MLFVILKPITEDVEVKKDKESFNEFIIFILLLMYTFSILIMILYGLLRDLYSDTFTIEKFYYHYIGPGAIMQVIISFIFVIILMYYVQKNFSKPLHDLHDIVLEYNLVKINKNRSDYIYYILNKLKTLSNSRYEVKSLTSSYKTMIENIEAYIIDLKKATIEKERITTELDIASKIQKSTIPNVFPPFKDRLNDFDIYASFNPAKNVGGDFYDYFLIDDDHLVVVIGDVSGKGVPAALFMMIAKSLINYQSHLNLSPSEIFYQLNNQLLENNAESMFVTVWLGIVEISSGKLTYANAGHNQPYLFNKSNNQYNILESKANFVLGGMENVKYKQYETQISEGDRLYLYTDGIIESINQNDEEFSNNRLKSCLNDNIHYNIKDLIFKISDEVHDFAKGMEQFDDETMLILEYKKKNL
ncbi:MAG: serine/threonine-protein phosphatase [Methanobrevibacter sp.]|nr:serine/threonine-protein phosphatase [Candidatus Methanovirga basalitermitum]